jgi:hypothetical protein
VSYIIKVRQGGYYYPITITPESGKLFLNFPYNEKLKDEIKVMAGARWNPDRKEWSITNNQRNLFQLRFLAGGNPYAKYDQPHKKFTPRRHWMMPHQIEMASFISTVKTGIFACEMGTGKTLTMIEVLEQSGHRDWWWVGPRNALFAVKNEFRKWEICDVCVKPRKQTRVHAGLVLDPCTCPVFLNHNCVVPRFLSYEELVKEVSGWPKDKIPPQGFVEDESSRNKNPTSQRSMAGQAMADAIREHWKDDAWVCEMSGSPAPKDPSDWWAQCEIAQPGYLREGDIRKFTNRLSLIEQRESQITGGTYPHRVTWFDNPLKCKICGQLNELGNHNLAGGGHVFQESKDEVSYLYQRMKGLVCVKLKKDCLNLPDKQYEIIELEPTAEMIRCASIIQAKCPTTIQALTLLRELSDGFQYKDEDIGQTQTCPRCHGTRVENVMTYCGPPDEEEHWMIEQSLGKTIPEGMYEPRPMACDHCSGTGEISRLVRQANFVPTPKEAALNDQLDLHEDVGRIVIFAGFTGAIDRVVGICKKAGWDTMRCDGRGWDSTIPGSPERLLEKFQESSPNKIAFIAHPASGGLGLNLTASPTIVYWSNDFNAESRIQSEDRIHRPGMDLNLGARIIDLICLKSDMLVLNNLKRKRRLQDMTLGQMQEEIAAIKYSDVRVY